MFFWKRKKTQEPKQSKQQTDTLGKSLQKNIDRLQQDILVNDETIKYRNFRTKEPHSRDCVLIYADSMAKHDFFSEFVIRPMMLSTLPTKISSNDVIDHIMISVIHSDGVSNSDQYEDIAESIIGGAGIIMVDNCSTAIVVDAQGWEKRGITEPVSESVVRGPREGFAETLEVNVSLVRRKIRTPKFKTKFVRVGTQTRTKVAIIYVEDIASPELIEEVVTRVEKITIDGILDSGYIEEWISDFSWNPFPGIGHTERPDIVAGKLLEGRVAILVDGSPVALTMPYLFVEAFQANEDYYSNWIVASFHRLLRYISYFITTMTPALYLALTTYHPHLIPTPLILSISVSRKNVPFPGLVEVVIMGLIFEILREGGLRLPQPIGQAVGIVGAIVLGDAAVKASLVSPIMIIVVALTGIAGFVVPPLNEPAVLVRLMLVFISSILGLYGFVLGVIAIGLQLASMKSFGVPYLSSLTSFTAQGSKDTTIRAPWWLMFWRPRNLAPGNRIRLQSRRSGGKRP